LKKGSLPFSRPYGTQFFSSGFIPGHKWLGYFHPPLTGLKTCLILARNQKAALKALKGI
jgi:hypothetical protein